MFFSEVASQDRKNKGRTLGPHVVTTSAALVRNKISGHPTPAF